MPLLVFVSLTQEEEEDVEKLFGSLLFGRITIKRSDKVGNLWKRIVLLFYREFVFKRMD